MYRNYSETKKGDSFLDHSVYCLSLWKRVKSATRGVLKALKPFSFSTPGPCWASLRLYHLPLVGCEGVTPVNSLPNRCLSRGNSVHGPRTKSWRRQCKSTMHVYGNTWQRLTDSWVRSHFISNLEMSSLVVTQRGGEDADENNRETTTPCVSIYTVSQKKVPTFKLSVTLSNLNRFSKFLHCWKAYEICYKIPR